VTTSAYVVVLFAVVAANARVEAPVALGASRKSETVGDATYRFCVAICGPAEMTIASRPERVPAEKQFELQDALVPDAGDESADTAP
jgi:hypothetical protein